MATYFTLSEINNWLKDNRNQFLELKSQEYPPLINPIYWTYFHFSDFIDNYSYNSNCENALKELKKILNNEFNQLSKWTEQYETLGSENLIMFQVNYNNWHEDVNEEFLKIHEGIYTERKPFTNIICFCEIFQLLYWDNNTQEIQLPVDEQIKIRQEVRSILRRRLLE